MDGTFTVVYEWGQTTTGNNIAKESISCRLGFGPQYVGERIVSKEKLQMEGRDDTLNDKKTFSSA